MDNSSSPLFAEILMHGLEMPFFGTVYVDDTIVAVQGTNGQVSTILKFSNK